MVHPHVGCLADYLSHRSTDTLLNISQTLDPDSYHVTCHFKLLLSNPKDNLGPWSWKSGESITPQKTRVKKGSPPSAIVPPTRLSHPFSFCHLTNYIYPSPYLREYCNLVSDSQPDHINNTRLPELKIKPITLPCLGACNSRSIVSSGPGILTKTLCLQNGSVQSPSSDFKLPFLNIGSGVVPFKKKRGEQNKRKQSSCSLVNPGIRLVPSTCHHHLSQENYCFEA
ncbi:uncharacterized protein LOC134814340 [Bolinopsis microptera]|uniref:uncharacterized protein LOC134814340 n=1 Tax=Bolinopsis microptera TaxID=2820187 RepID=UPI00307A7CB2